MDDNKITFVRRIRRRTVRDKVYYHLSLPEALKWFIEANGTDAYYMFEISRINEAVKDGNANEAHESEGYSDIPTKDQ